MRPRGAITRASLLALLVLGGCADDEGARTPPPSQPTKAPSAERPQGPRYYDADGRLKESGRRVAGVAVPVGFEAEPFPKRRTHVFRSREIPFQKVLEYFGPRLFTGQIERRGSTVIYRDAVPMDQRDAPFTVDVRIASLDAREVQVTFRQSAQAPLVAPSVQELEKTLRREQKQIE